MIRLTRLQASCLNIVAARLYRHCEFFDSGQRLVGERSVSSIDQQVEIFFKGVTLWVDVHVVEAVDTFMAMEPVALLPRGGNWWSLSRRPMEDRCAAGFSRMAV
jgi:hypothetical protein